MKRALKAAAFLLIGVVLIGYVSQVLVGKWTWANKETYTTKEFYALEDNSIEVFVVGSSQVVTGISSMTMYEDNGISAFGLGMGSAPLMGNYYWIKECKKTQDISTVVIEASMLYEPTRKFLYRRALDPMKMSLNKLEAVQTLSQEGQSEGFMSYVFPFIKYHGRWKELTKEDFVYRKEDTLVYRGNVMKSSVKPVPFKSIIIDNDKVKDVSMDEEQLRYFEKIVSYCEENGINVVLVKVPKNSWSRSKSLGVKKLAREHGLPFLDFNESSLMKEIGFNPLRDMRDADHPNLRGAEKVSAYLGDYLKENYDLKDYREESYNPVDMDLYYEDREDCYLKMSTGIREYLENLDNDRYGVIIQMTDDISADWNEVFQKRYEALGLQTDISQLGGKNYVAVLEHGKCVYEEAAVQGLSYEGVFSNGTPYAAWGDIRYKEEDVKMQIGRDERFFDKKGMNILVYEIGKDRILNEAVIRKQPDGVGLELKMVYRYE